MENADMDVTRIGYLRWAAPFGDEPVAATTPSHVGMLRKLSLLGYAVEHPGRPPCFVRTSRGQEEIDGFDQALKPVHLAILRQLRDIEPAVRFDGQQPGVSRLMTGGLIELPHTMVWGLTPPGQALLQRVELDTQQGLQPRGLG